MGHELKMMEPVAGILESNKELGQLMKELTDAQHELKSACDEKQRQLEEGLEYQELRESWRQLEGWAKATETQLRSKDAGDSVLSVKSLLAKHDTVESSVKLHVGSLAAFDSIEQRGQEMLRQSYGQPGLGDGKFLFFILLWICSRK